MTPEERQMLRDALELSRKNNVILNKLYRASLWGRAVKVLYWVILVGITIGSLYFLQPYIDTLQDVYGAVGGTQDQMRSLFTR